MRILALDVGDKRIGVAVSDLLGILASPLTAIERTSDSKAINAILRTLDEQEAGEIVVGLPISLSGGYSGQTKSVAAFVRKLEERSPVPVKTVDERYSTVEAERLLSQSKPTRARAEARSTPRRRRSSCSRTWTRERPASRSHNTAGGPRYSILAPLPDCVLVPSRQNRPERLIY